MAAAATEIGLRLKEEEKEMQVPRNNLPSIYLLGEYGQKFGSGPSFDLFLSSERFRGFFLTGERIRLTQELNLNQPLYGRYV